MRTFQYSDAKSHKFWNIEVSGGSFTVTYGKVGASGQTQTKSFANPEQAQAEADKLVREKLKKGYVETTPKPAATHAEAFEQALAADPHDLDAAGVYADWLEERGDPRGEFMRVQIALENESLPAAARKGLHAREKELLKKYEKEWLGPLAAVTVNAEPVPTRRAGIQGTRAPVGHRFARGWLSRLEFHDLTVDQVRTLARAPQARLLRELVVETIENEAPVGATQRYIDSYYEPGPDVPTDVEPYEDPGLHALCRCPQLANVRLFCLGELADRGHGREEEYLNCHTSGQLAHHLVKQMLHLEELYLLAHHVDAGKIFSLPLPGLRVLQLYHSDSYPLDKLAANPSLAKLNSLLCHPHAIEHEETGAYIRLPHLRAVCRSPHLTALAHLQLRLTDFGDAGAKEIVESGVLKRLKVLDLQGGCMTDEGAMRLARCPDLKRLDYLNLSRNALTPAGVQAITAAGVRSNLSSQHNEASGEFGDGDVPEYLFEGDIEQSMPTPRYLLIANPGTKRCETYRRELLAFWADRGATPEVEVVPWADVAPRDGNLDDLPAFNRPAVVRLESPGKDGRVLRLLLEAGARDNPAEPPCDWRSLEIPKGLLPRPGLWYRGFRRVLGGLARAFAARPHLAPTACPLAVAEMFDKTATAVKLRAAEAPTPAWLENPRDVFAEMADGGRGWPTAYLKLNTGSSATGIIALRSEAGRLHGTTTLAEIGGRFFNSRRLLHLTDAALERAAEFLFREGAFAQQGIPMAQIDGQNFDVRVVCVYGRPAASIFRLSSGPMTNLELGGRRGAFGPCRAAIPTRDWLDALDHCADAAGCFDSAIAGVDLVFECGFRRHFVLEVNAFGDFFPGWTEAGGRSVHALEIGETTRKFE